jgi:hypothetical protein
MHFGPPVKNNEAERETGVARGGQAGTEVAALPCTGHARGGRCRHADGHKMPPDTQKLFQCAKLIVSQGWWLTPEILATQEAEIRRIAVQNQPRQIVH